MDPRYQACFYCMHRFGEECYPWILQELQTFGMMEMEDQMYYFHFFGNTYWIQLRASWKRNHVLVESFHSFFPQEMKQKKYPLHGNL